MNIDIDYYFMIIFELTNSFPIALYGCIGIFQLHELMTHQSPRRQIIRIYSQGSFKILNRFVMLPFQTVQISYTLKNSL